MDSIEANGLALAYATEGDGAPLVLVHGNWSDARVFAAVAERLAGDFRVVRYDRRGHGASERPLRHGTLHDQADDLAALIEALDCAPAHVVASSFGGSVALTLATRRPELLRSLAVHEPPLAGIAAADARVARAGAAIEAIAQRVAGGDAEGGTRQFMEEVALGPGAWELLPAPAREIALWNAPGFAGDVRDPGWGTIDRDALAAVEVPLLLSGGDGSPAWFAPIVATLARTIESAATLTIPGAGHGPHASHPDAYAEAVGAFARAAGGARVAA